MPTYTVAVKVTLIEFYKVEAADALKDWRGGEFYDYQPLESKPLQAGIPGEDDEPDAVLADTLDVSDPPDYLAEDAARRRFEIAHNAWIEEHGPEFERVMEELEAEHPAALPEPEDPDMGF